MLLGYVSMVWMVVSMLLGYVSMAWDGCMYTVRVCTDACVYDDLIVCKYVFRCRMLHILYR